ncbi:MAG: hypothetical protein LUH07_05475, partial [Lachnospiraceae bacterium]|nr:hypothetical protein [Lachnospiraceae bacterium]
STSSEERSASEEIAEETEGVAYPIEGAGTLSYGFTMSSRWSEYYEYWDETPIGQELEASTGVDLDMVHVADKTAMNLLLASGELPDIITYNFANNYTGGNEKAMSDGLIYQMTEDFVQTYAPDYWQFLEDNPDIMRQVKTSDGSIFGFCFALTGADNLSQQGLIVRGDWLDTLGLDEPETADEFKEMLSLFKSEMGAQIPLELTASTLNSVMRNGYITTPFNLVCMGEYQIDGTVHVGYAEQEFKDVLQWLHELYEEGLLDPNFATVDTDTVNANMSTGAAGASQGAATSGIKTWMDAAGSAVEEEGFSLIGIKGLVANAGDVPLYGHLNYSVPGNMSVISSMCSDPVTAAQYFNYGYTHAGYMLYNYGIEGVTYIADGNYNYVSVTEEVANGDIDTAFYTLSYGNGPFEACPPDYSSYLYQEMADARQVAWVQHTASEYQYPNVSVSSEYSNEYSNLVSELETYRDEMIIKFVRGDESLDNFDDYLNTLESIGMSRYIEMLQNAADEYYAK